MVESENLKEIVKTGHGIARFLKEHGVQYIFGIPDGSTLALYDGIHATEGIDHVLFNDERSAAFAADAYARITGKMGVCDAGAAGSMNFPVALAEAKGSASPVLAIVGLIETKNFLRNLPHDINVADTLSPITKWTKKVIRTENLTRFATYALKQAINGRPGPVALAIAGDVLSSSVLKLKDFIPHDAGEYSVNKYRTTPARNEIDQALKMILQAKQPAIFSGGGAVLSGAFTEIAELSRILKAPVFSTNSGKGIMISKDNPLDNLYFGTVGLFGARSNNKFLKSKADLIIVVGNRLTEDDTANFRFPDQKTKMIQIDIEPSEIGLSYKPWGVVGDPKAALFEIIRRLRKYSINKELNEEILVNRMKNLEQLKKNNSRFKEIDSKKWMESEPIKPQRILKSISDVLTGEDYLVTDASASSRWVGAYYPVKSLGRKIITPRGVGPTGFGVGALIGTCIAVETLQGKENEVKKVLFTGDGGLMNGGINEFETICKLGLNCTIIIINNSQLGYIKFAQTFLSGKRYFETDRPHTNFARIVDAFGGKGFRVEKLADLDSTIQEAINSKGFTLVDVVVDPQEYLPPNSFV